MLYLTVRVVQSASSVHRSLFAFSSIQYNARNRFHVIKPTTTTGVPQIGDEEGLPNLKPDFQWGKKWTTELPNIFVQKVTNNVLTSKKTSQLFHCGSWDCHECGEYPRIFYGILLVPHNNIMALNNIMIMYQICIILL